MTVENDCAYPNYIFCAKTDCDKENKDMVAECYVDDGKRASKSWIERNMAFARATGGMDSI